MKIIFVRHGKSIDDIDEVSQRDDSPLSPAAVKAVQKRASDFSAIHVKKCYVSNYRRARDTAAIMFPGVPMEVRNDIFEVKRPAFLTGGKHADAVHFWEVLHRDEKYIPDWSFDGSESFNDVVQRARGFLDYLKQNHESSEDPIIVVSHGGFMRHLIGVACLGDKYTPTVFFELLLPMDMDNLAAVSLDIRSDNKVKWSLA